MGLLRPPNPPNLLSLPCYVRILPQETVTELYHDTETSFWVGSAQKRLFRRTNSGRMCLKPRPGIESRWGGRDIPHLSTPALGPTQTPVQFVLGFPWGGKERPGRDADPSPPSSAVGHDRVELYLYSRYGPYGVYRASVPVQGCTLPYLLICQKNAVINTFIFQEERHKLHLFQINVSAY